MGAGVGRRPDTRSREELCRDPCARRSHRSGGWARQPSSASPPPPSPPSPAAPASGDRLVACLQGLERHPGRLRACGRRERRPARTCCSPSATSALGGASTTARRAPRAATASCTSPTVGRRPLRRPGKGDSGRGLRPGRHAAAGDRPDRLHRRAGPDRPRRRTSAAARPCWRPTSRDTASAASGDWTKAVADYAGHRRRGRDGAVHRTGLRRAAQRRHRDHRRR